MKRLIVLPALVFSTLASSAVFAAPPRPVERARNNQAIREDKRELANDRWDRARLEHISAEYKDAIAKNQPNRLEAIEDRFLAELSLEIGESRVEVAEKQQEVNQSRREAGKERREVARDVVRGRPVKAVRDAADHADDRRDLADDRADRRREVAQLQQKTELRSRFQALRGVRTPAALTEKSGIIDQTLALAQAEVQGDKAEVREDRGERREDRRDAVRPD